MGLLQALAGRQADRDARWYRDMIRREAKIGGELFGPVAPDARREFFCLDEYTWVWHEEWVGPDGSRRAVTTRYDIRPQGILKAQDGQPYHYIGREEARSFHKAVQLYTKRVREELYANV